MPLHKLLIVSDQEGDRLFLKDYFAVRDYEVELASSGTETLEKLGWYKPSVIILDLNGSSGMDNIECLGGIQKNHSDIETVILASNPDSGKMQQAKDLKVHEYFIKPYSLRTLERTVRNLV